MIVNLLSLDPTLRFWGAELNLKVLGVLSAVVAMDIILRWLAFMQVESTGLDIAIFGAVFSGTEALFGEGRGDVMLSTTRIWIGIILVVIAVIVHRTAAEEQRNLIVEDLAEKLQETEKDAHLGHLVQVGEFALLLTLSATKPGKRRRREKFLRAIADNAQTAEGKSLVALPDGHDLLLLPENRRRMYRWALATVGFVAVLTPVVTIHP